MVAAPSFSILESNYSTEPTSVHECRMHFPNTCAIRMSEALVKTDKKFLTAFLKSTKNKCPHGYMRGAQDLAAVLALPSVLGPRTLGWNAQPSGEAPPGAVGKKGIVCFMNVPGYSGQGHIDLWDRIAPVGSAYWRARTIWMWVLQ